MDTTAKKAFILIGRSGCGKGTQAKLLSEYLGKDVLYIQTGEAVRNFSSQTGYTAGISKSINDLGGLQPEFLAVYMWVGMLVKDYTGTQSLIFDGVPRRVHEAGMLHSVFEFYKIAKPQIVYINVSNDWSTERLLARGRHDDIREDIVARLGWFDKEVVPVLDFYRKNDYYDFHEINGEQTPEAVHAELISKVFGK